MSHNRKKFITGLSTLVFGSFLTAVILLPQRGSYGFNGAIDRFFKMRTDWYIAWAVLFGGLFASLSIFLIVEAFVKKDE
ncbi:MAG: hypothetical protein ACYS72_05785 [Planctomycetota bacterium]|jgi:hypothetical protein